MIANGYTPEFAERTFRQLEGFGSYGFPESHAACFALIAYASSWMKCHHPDVFCAAILNAQPMGFYAPAQLVRDAESTASRSGRSTSTTRDGTARWSRPTTALRRAARLAHGAGLANAMTAPRSSQRAHERRSRPSRICGAARACRSPLWSASPRPMLSAPRPRPAAGALGNQGACATNRCRSSPRPTSARIVCGPEVRARRVALAPMTPGREVVEDYRSMGLTLRAHPVAFLRDDLAATAIVPCARSQRDAATAAASRSRGLVLVRQRPGSAKGVMFITLEDETDIANLIVWPSVFERQRRLILSAGMIGVPGPGAAGGRGHPPHRRAPHRPVGSARLGWRPRRTFPSRGARRRSQARRRPRPARVHSGASPEISTFPICGSRVRST